MPAHRLVAPGLCLSVLLLLASCGGGAGSDCTSDGDCDDGLVCQVRTCTALDAGQPGMDAGGAPDAGGDTDASAGGDAGDDTDAGGASADAGSDIDASSDTDAGTNDGRDGGTNGRRDAGTVDARDSGAPRDGGMCATDGQRCGGSVARCCGGLRCCSGTPVPPGMEFCAVTCPRCAAPDTPIATPAGDVAIEDLAVGDLVYSEHDGALVAVPIREVSRTPVVDHHVVRVSLDSGAVLLVSAGHPTADGRTFGDLGPGQPLGELTVRGVATVPYPHAFTYDILPASDTGTYLAAGALIGSTLLP